MGLCKSRRRKSLLLFLSMAILIAVICSGCNDKDKDAAKIEIFGPFVINSSGDLLFCVVKRGSVNQNYIIPLRNRHSQPIALQFPGSESCLGATWRSGAGHDELLFITGGTPQIIKRFRVSDASLSEVSSYTIDPNLIVMVRPYWYFNRVILALRVTKYVENTFSGAYLGFSKDNGQTISISEISPGDLLWIDQFSFYMAHNLEEGGMVMSKVQLDIDSMTVQTRDILQEDEIILATQSLNGSLIYVTGQRLFRDNEMLALLPEQIGRPFVNGSYLACVSKNKRRIYILNDKGEILGTKQKNQRSRFVGLSAANRCVYLTTEDRKKIIGYNFIEKREEVVFDPSSTP